jgi:hypothetical protein
VPTYLPHDDAQAGAAINDPEAKIASSLSGLISNGSTVVSGVKVKITSPAMWVVSRGNRRVTVLGVPWLLSPDATWNRYRLQNRLRESNHLMLPPLLQPAVGRETLGLSDAKIPGAYRARLQKAADSIGQPVSRYIDLNPLIAGYLLTTDFRAKINLEDQLATWEVIHVAEAMAESKIELAPRISPDLPSEDTGPGARAELACLDAALNEVEAGKPAFDKAINAWAAGDVRTALTAPRGLEQCSFAFAYQVKAQHDSVDAQVQQIIKALDERRSDVVVGYLRALLSENGVLDRLKAHGYKIEAPAAS